MSNQYGPIWRGESYCNSNQHLGQRLNIEPQQIYQLISAELIDDKVSFSEIGSLGSIDPYYH